MLAFPVTHLVQAQCVASSDNMVRVTRLQMMDGG